MDHWAISNEALARVHQSLTSGEQLVWTGKPEPGVDLGTGSKFVYRLSQVCLPLFLLFIVLGHFMPSLLIILACTGGVAVTGVVIVGMKAIRQFPVAFEEYALTNRRAFSYFESNGVVIFASIWLDTGTTIKKQRCGPNCSSLHFMRPHGIMPEASKRRGLGNEGRVLVAFLNLKEADYPKKLAEWAVADTSYARQFMHRQAA